MWLLLGAAAGALLAAVLPASMTQVPPFLMPYLPCAILAALEGALFALRARQRGTFSARTAARHAVSMLLFAVLLTYLGALADAALGQAANIALAWMAFQSLGELAQNQRNQRKNRFVPQE